MIADTSRATSEPSPGEEVAPDSSEIRTSEDPSAAPVSARHSASSPEWGTPELVQRLASAVLIPASQSGGIDLDAQSSGYWHAQWPAGVTPAFLFDGSPQADAFDLEVWRSFAKGKPITTFLNPAGGDGGALVQRSWSILEYMHSTGVVASGFWVGFSLEQFASLQNADRTATITDLLPDRQVSMSPLDARYTTIIPSRRACYRVHPARALADLEARISKLGGAVRALTDAPQQLGKLDRKREVLVSKRDAVIAHMAKHGDVAIPGDAPTHSSYFTILWHALAKVRDRQKSALRRFLAEQAKVRGSLFERVQVIGHGI